MEVVAVIRHKVLTEGVPIRDVARQLGLSRNTIRRYVRAKVVPVAKPASVTRPAPAREQVAEVAAAIWAARRSFTAGKQRLTATRLWELLCDDGHEVSARTVRRLVASFRNAEREVTVPLVHEPGELAQVDNLSAAVAKILVGAPRVLRPRFAAMIAHYALEAPFCRPGEGHDKGGVESRGGHVRWQHLVPLPRGQTLVDISAAVQVRIDA